MLEYIGYFILCTAVVFGVILIFGFDLCFKDRVKLFAGFEIFLALLITGVYILAK